MASAKSATEKGRVTTERWGEEVPSDALAAQTETLASLFEAVGSSRGFSEGMREVNSHDTLRKKVTNHISIPQGHRLSPGPEPTVRGRKRRQSWLWASWAGWHLPLAESFLVLMILAAYSCPASTFTHLRTTEKAPLGGQRR